MPDSSHATGPEGGIMLGSSYRRHRDRSRRGLLLFAAPLLVVLVAVGAGLWIRHGGGGESAALGPLLEDSMPAMARGGTASPGESADTLDLPPLDGSDAFVRDVARGLSAHPGWASWLVTDDLVRRFVSSVVTVSTGSRPRDGLAFLAPEGDFRVRESDDGAVIHPGSHRRYDLVAGVFVGLDEEGTAGLYRRLHPLFERAHRELGLEDGTFDRTLARAVERILAVRVPDGPLRVVPDEAVWVFEDPELEARSALAKQLLRMGPENARRIQAKLRRLADALELPVDEPSTDTRGEPSTGSQGEAAAGPAPEPSSGAGGKPTS